MGSNASGVRKQRWVLLYEKAVFEHDESKRLDFIALAKGAIFQRRQELVLSRTKHIQDEEALEDAAYVLTALGKAAEFNRKR
jgi:hypothetical protein